MGMPYQCSTCNELHDDLPHIGSDRPANYWDVPESERPRRIKLGTDTCEIDGKYFFVRGVLEIPVQDYPAGFAFGVWVSHKQENFETYLANPDSAAIGPFFGWLCTNIAYYAGGTLMLKTMAHYKSGGLRPSIVLEPTEHPLALDQLFGISLKKAWEIVHFYDKKSSC